MIARKRARAKVIDKNEKLDFIARKLAPKRKSEEFWFLDNDDKKYFNNIRFADTGPTVVITLILYNDNTETNRNKLGIRVESAYGETKRFSFFGEIDLTKFGITGEDLNYSSEMVLKLPRRERENRHNKLRLAYGKIRDPVEAKILEFLDQIDGFWDYSVEILEQVGQGDKMLHFKF